MSTPALPRGENPLFMLTKRDEDILKAVAFHRYMTLADITRLLGFAYPASMKYVGKILAQLAGGQDYQDREYLYRFPLPHIGSGNTERVYTLGSAGRAHLKESGMEIDWYFRPSDTASLSYQHLQHALTLTRVLVAAQLFARSTPEADLADIQTEYTLKGQAMSSKPAGKHQEGRKEGGMIVVPDAWLDFRINQRGHHSLMPVLLEVDRGTEQQQYFKRHVAARAEFVKQDGEYERIFGTNFVTVAYVTTGGDQRLTSMLKWTEEVLQSLGKRPYAEAFRFCSLPQGEADPDGLFLLQAWYTPFVSQPVSLLAV